MIYLYLDRNTIKLLYLKKTLLGQQETSFNEKTYETDLLKDGHVINIDLLASAIKEVTTLSAGSSSDNQVFLILPQEAFYFFRAEVPGDIAPSALTSFIKDKARSIFPLDPDLCLTGSFIQEANEQKVVSFFGLSKEVFNEYQQVLSLIDLRISSVISETLALFKLFEKTLRREKREIILYGSFENNRLSGYLFDTFGLLEEKRLILEIKEEDKLEKVLKEEVENMAENKIRLNRIILSGEASEKIRQDTFTKAVGAWTNPLKRIIPNFYDEYLKMLVVEGKKSFPILRFDVCFGAFIFHLENPDFSLLKEAAKISLRKPLFLPKLTLPKKPVLLFLGSFILSFLIFVIISNIKFNLKLPLIKKPEPTAIPTHTPIPTSSFKKEELKIKVLNGSGIAGKATDVKNILKDKGYGEIITDNADSFDYVKTEVQIKKFYSQAVSMLKTDLKDYLTDFKESALDASSTADLILIVGRDFK